MTHTALERFQREPILFFRLLWPEVRFYDKQIEIIESVRDNDETFVPAGNMLGKDYVAAAVALWFFLTRHPVRIVTTSADHSQLQSVLWGEMRRFLQTSAIPLDVDKGGPLVINHLHLRKAMRLPDGSYGTDGLSYMIGRVAAKGEGMLGHHIARTGDGVPHTLFIADEASGVDDVSYERALTWCHRLLAIGNPFGMTGFFKRYCQAGDLLAKVS